MKPDYRGLLLKLRFFDALSLREYVERYHWRDSECSLEDVDMESLLLKFDNVFDFGHIGFSGYWIPLFDLENENLGTISTIIKYQKDLRLYIPDSLSRKDLFINSFTRIYNSLSLEKYDTVRIKQFYFYPIGLRTAIGLRNADTVRNHFYNIFDTKDSLKYQSLVYNLQVDKNEIKGTLLLDTMDFIKYEEQVCDYTYRDFFHESAGFSFEENLGQFFEASNLTLDEAKRYYTVKLSENSTVVNLPTFQFKGVLVTLILIPFMMLFFILISLSHLSQVKSFQTDNTRPQEGPAYIFCYRDRLSQLLTAFMVIIAPAIANATSIISTIKSQVQWENMEKGFVAMSTAISIFVLFSSVYLLLELRKRLV